MTPLRQRMMEDMRVRNLSPHTQSTYVLQVSLFARYFRKPPDQLGPEEIRSYQVYLTDEKKLSPGSILIAVAALRFLYKVTLHKDWSVADIIPAPKKPQKLFVVLSPQVRLQECGRAALAGAAVLGGPPGSDRWGWPRTSPSPASAARLRRPRPGRPRHAVDARSFPRFSSSSSSAAETSGDASVGAGSALFSIPFPSFP